RSPAEPCLPRVETARSPISVMNFLAASGATFCALASGSDPSDTKPKKAMVAMPNFHANAIIYLHSSMTNPSRKLSYGRGLHAIGFPAPCPVNQVKKSLPLCGLMTAWLLLPGGHGAGPSSALRSKLIDRTFAAGVKIVPGAKA